MAIPLFSRRSALLTALACGACDRLPKGMSNLASNLPFVPFRQATSLPIGCAITTQQMSDPKFVPPFVENFSQVTAEYEMKMNAILNIDGAYNFAPADAIVSFAMQNRMRVHGHALVWYKHTPKPLLDLDGTGEAFAKAYRDYILTVVGRYRGQVAGWDVVNEPITHKGDAFYDSLWSKNLGAEDYIIHAFDHAHEADPDAILFMNEYDLERLPGKRLLFMRLVEKLLKRGAKISGIGSQTHIDVDDPKGMMGTALKDLASFGLPIHVSELDITFRRKKFSMQSQGDLLEAQAEQGAEVVEAYMALPAKQRYAITLWGMRDSDSWLRRPPFVSDPPDQPLAFDEGIKPKPMARIISERLRKGAQIE